jgi:hypothetical protein
MFKGKTEFVIYAIDKILEMSSIIYSNVVLCQIWEQIVLIIFFFRNANVLKFWDLMKQKNYLKKLFVFDRCNNNNVCPPC